MKPSFHASIVPRCRSIRAGWAVLAAWFTLLLAAWPAGSALGAEEPAPPGFLIERIVVEGLRRASAEIIVSESLLEAGESYTEREILQGVHRVEHLPFVLGVEVSLRRGSERGKYELVLTVREARRFFFGADVTTTRLSRSLGAESDFFPDTTPKVTTTIGIRQFVGSYGLAFAAFGEGETLQVGFSHYRLLNRPIFGSIALSKVDCCLSAIFPLGLDPSFSSWSTRDSRSAAFTLGVPLHRDRSLRLHLTLTEADGGSRSEVLGRSFFDDYFLHDELQEARLEALWIADSTDDALFPTAGRLITAGLDYRTVEAEQSLVDFDPGSVLPRREIRLPAYDANLVRAVVTGAVYWTPGGRQTFSASGRLAVGRALIDHFPIGGEDVVSRSFQSLEASLGLRQSMALRSPSRRRLGELRWENTLDYGFEATSSGGIHLDESIGQLRLGTSLVYRNTWGVFRLGFVYLDVRRL